MQVLGGGQAGNTVVLPSIGRSKRARTGAPLRTFQLRNLDAIPGIEHLSADQLHDIEVVGRVLPFKTNDYVCEQLIDWNDVPDDPIFRLTFPHRDMLDPDDYERVDALLRSGASRDELAATAHEIQRRLNPHPGGQADDNVPTLDGHPVEGMQHKYRPTVLFFPSQGQTCHAYCTYCFRWAQFVDLDDLRFASKDTGQLVAYLRAHPEVSDVLFTGGDPLIMRTEVLARYIEPLLAPEFEGLCIRIGTKAPAYWPNRFTDGDDAEALLRLFERIVDAGRHLALMVHFSHPRELSTPTSRAALRRIAATGATMRSQTPVVRHVNDDSAVLATLWNDQVGLGIVPYYLFVERNTGARRYFEMTLSRALELHTVALQHTSGLGRTVRGPVMSAYPGKVLLEGIVGEGDERAFLCRMLQSRDPALDRGIFFARYDEHATWFDELEPAPGTSLKWFPHLDRG